MTDPQAVVMTALARGRLIFPFKAELSKLNKAAKAGPLTAAETERRTKLTGLRERLSAKDKWFHSAMAGGDLEAAQRVAEEARVMLEEAA